MKCCGICLDGCSLRKREEALRPARKPMPKPKVEGDVQETVLRDFSGRTLRRDRSILWAISCPCEFGGSPFQVVPSWEAAVEIALTHGRSHA